MTARWQLLSPDRLETAAEGHRIVAAEYRARARYFENRAEEFEQQAADLRGERAVRS